MAHAPLKSVLYVDDDPYLQIIIKAVLTSMGKLTVRTTTSGKAGIAELANFTPDLLLLDVVMPELDGPDTLELIRRLPGMEQVPVIFLTARTDDNDIAYYASLGAIGVIPKPFEPLDLMEQVHKLWEQHEWPSAAVH